eukprot:symbB.v1.2.022986.t1/scaffold2038.1/size91535/2
MWWCIWLYCSALCLVAQASSLHSCDHRWRQDEALAQLYLRLSQWDKEGAKHTHHFYDVSTTFILLARGASFARQPTQSEEAMLHPKIKDRLLSGLNRLGGYPERCGICVAALDTLSLGIQNHFRPGSFGHQTAADLQVEKHEP